MQTTLDGSGVHSNLFFTGRVLARPVQFRCGGGFFDGTVLSTALPNANGAARADASMTTAAIRRLAAIPSPEELIGRAREMAPEIRALAEEPERNRTLFPHIIDKIRDAELLRGNSAASNMTVR